MISSSFDNVDRLSSTDDFDSKLFRNNLNGHDTDIETSDYVSLKIYLITYYFKIYFFKLKFFNLRFYLRIVLICKSKILKTLCRKGYNIYIYIYLILNS